MRSIPSFAGLRAMLLLLLICKARVQAAAVFAHFMLENANNFSAASWTHEYSLAKEAHIDAFALNMRYGIPDLVNLLYTAIVSAQDQDFKVFFSFDYAGGKPWPKEEVSSLLSSFGHAFAYYQHQGKPLVSTFEGTDNADDWHDLKSESGCFFIPDWSSLGAKEALELAGGVADGLFNWHAWPWGNTNMDTYVDASYYQYVVDGAKKAYMMPVSPWFYTNLPGYKKNWLWRGDDLWYDRWFQIVYNQPDFVQIISWNDYGESHHIGPYYSNAAEAMTIGKAPFNYASVRPHDGWRLTLPYWIDTYKTGKATVTKEGIVAWYRKSPGAACGTGGTVGNTASHLQLEFPPDQVMQDKIFFSAVLGSPATVTVSTGGVSKAAEWTATPEGGIGVYHGSIPFFGSGAVTVTLMRGSTALATVHGGPSISSDCTIGLTEWNAWVGSATIPGSVSATPALSRSQQKCIAGWGPGDFAGLCNFTCKYGYCPISACVCTKLGAPVKDVAVTKPKGYPGPGKSGSYIGLCEYTCARDYCPSPACSYTQSPIVTPTVSEFLPPACVAGAGPGMFGGLCGFSCDFGFCPMNVCTCSRQGPLNPAPAKTKDDATALASLGDDNGLCTFACSHGYCPDDTCSAFDPSTDDEADDIDGLDGDFPTCDQTYAKLEDIPDDAPWNCAPIYILETLRGIFIDTLTRYNDIIAHDHYDAKFNTYAEAVVQSAPYALREFYMDHGKDYFDCQVVEGQTCCGTCWRQYGQGAQQCRYCDGTLCSGNGVKYTNVTEPCPPDFSLRSSVNAANREGDTIYWTMRGDRVTAFYTDLETSTGIPKEDTAIGVVNHLPTTCTNYPECFNHGFDFGVPVVTVGYNKSDVGNPKEIIANALQSVDHLKGELDATILTLRSYNVRNYSANDVVDVAALPILMMQQAVESMTQVVEVAGEIEAEKRKALILSFILGFLMLIPIGGQIIGRISSLAGLGRIIALTGEAGLVATDIYSVVDDPASVPFVLFTYILGLGALRDADKVTSAANVRRAMTDQDIAKLGKGVADGLGKIGRIAALCSR